MLNRPFTVIDSVSVPEKDIAATRARLTNREGCTVSFVENAAKQAWQIYKHPDGRIFTITSGFAKKRGALLAFTLCEIELAL